MAKVIRTRSRQRGLSFLGLLFLGTLGALVMVIGAQIFPTWVEYQAVGKAVNVAVRPSVVTGPGTRVAVVTTVGAIVVAVAARTTLMAGATAAASLSAAADRTTLFSTAS